MHTAQQAHHGRQSITASCRLTACVCRHRSRNPERTRGSTDICTCTATREIIVDSNTSEHTRDGERHPLSSVSAHPARTHNATWVTIPRVSWGTPPNFTIHGTPMGMDSSSKPRLLSLVVAAPALWTAVHQHEFEESVARTMNLSWGITPNSSMGNTSMGASRGDRHLRSRRRTCNSPTHLNRGTMTTCMMSGAELHMYCGATPGSTNLL